MSKGIQAGPDIRPIILCAVLFATTLSIAGINDGPDPVNRGHGKRGNVIGGLCNDKQVTACKLWAFDAAAASGQWLIPTVTCESGPEMLGGPLAGAMTFCGAYVIDPVTGDHVPLPPPPVTLGR